MVTERQCKPRQKLFPKCLPNRGKLILPVRKGADIPVDSRYAACRPRLTAAQGPR